MRTKHFRIRTSYADVKDLYNLMLKFSEQWAGLEIAEMQLFHANFTDVYLSVKAGRWYHYSVANDPDWPGDAEDLIAHGVYRGRYRALRSRPRPEATWKGTWRKFALPSELSEYASTRLTHLFPETPASKARFYHGILPLDKLAETVI